MWLLPTSGAYYLLACDRVTKVLSELKQHLGTEPDIWYPLRKKKGERGANVHELSLLRSIHDQKTHQENRTWLRNLLLLSMPTNVQ
jgi:iron-sulfur cluster repair protein YtfE (RIC family)